MNYNLHDPHSRQRSWYLSSVLYIVGALFIIFQLVLATDELKGNTDQYQERLFLRPLGDGKLFAQFQFTTVYRKDVKSLKWENKFQLFPLSMSEIVSVADLNKLHFSLTKGNWNDRNWGYSSRAAPPGAQIRVNFSQHNQLTDKSWSRLINLLAGKFCASLTGANVKTRVISRLAFRNEYRENSTLTSKTYYANLAEETLCTENLTPWKKLLPCPTNSGLAPLLNSENILRSSYSSLAIDLQPIKCPNTNDQIISDCEKTQLTQTFSVVFNPLSQFEGKQTWSIIKLFGKGIQRTCPVSSSSKILVDITDLDDIQKLYPKNYQIEDLIINDLDGSFMKRTYASYILNSQRGQEQQARSQSNSNMTWPFNVGIKQKSIFKFAPFSSRPKLPVEFSTNIAGIGSIEGTMVASISNNLNEPITVTYMDIVPNFLRIYTHTMKIRSLKTNNEFEAKEKSFSLSEDEGRSSNLIELLLVIPANDQIQIHYDFERSFLRWTDYKPDANKGVVMGSASLRVSYCCKCLKNSIMPISSRSSHTSTIDSTNISLSCNKLLEEEQGDLFRLYARPLLVIQPTPDFSMAYNVICIVCTVLVAGFGPIHNITTRGYRVIVTKKKEKEKTTGESVINTTERNGAQDNKQKSN